MCHIGTWSTRYCTRTVEKIWRSKVKKIYFAECISAFAECEEAE